MTAGLYPERGEIYWIDWSPSRGSEQAGRRPGLVISADPINRAFPVCTVLAVTTRIRDSQIAVTLPAGVMPRQSQVMPWQVMTVSHDRLEEFIVRLSSELRPKLIDH